MQAPPPPAKPEIKHPNEALVERFWTAWQRKYVPGARAILLSSVLRDGAAMRACYHPDVEFSDPVFPSLKSACILPLNAEPSCRASRCNCACTY